MEPRRISLATIRMNIHGIDREFNVPVPMGPSRLLDLLPATGTIASEEAQANIDAARARGEDISCRAGCGACCRQPVAISAVEAKGLAELVGAMPVERQSVIRERFAAGIRKLEEARLLDASEPPGARYLRLRNEGPALDDLGHRYVRLGIACPFLDDESCGIYEHRPAVCRQYHVTSPAENCQRAYEPTGSITRLEAAFHISHLLGILAERAAGIEQSTMLLIQSLEWSASQGESLDRTADGPTLFGQMMNEIGRFAQGARG